MLASITRSNCLGTRTMQPTFPLPDYFGRRRHWRLSKLLDYERQLAGLAPQLEPSDHTAERFLTAAHVRERYNVPDMWIWRRIKDAEQAAERGQEGAEQAQAA